MTLNGWFQILLFFAAVLAVTKPMGIFMARVFSGEKTFFLLAANLKVGGSICALKSAARLFSKHYRPSMV